MPINDQIIPTSDLVSTPTTVISFEEGSTLKAYIEKKSLISKTFYVIGEVLAILKTVIIKEKMYDEGNPYIVLCSQELEEALDRKALHVSQLTDRIMSQIAWAENYSMGFFKGAFPFLEPSQKNNLSC